MQTTKSEILALLKRGGPRSVGALADELGLAPMTVRQHLTSLERDGLVHVAAERRPIGRPHYLYTLTEKGEQSFPRRYDRLASQLLSELSLLDPTDLVPRSPQGRVDYLLQRLADRVADAHGSRLAHEPLEGRVREVAAILQEESGFVELEAGDGRLVIRDYNCMYRSLTEPKGPICAWHRRLIERLVGLPPANTGETARDGCCQYVIAAVEAARATDSIQRIEVTLGQRIPQEVH